MKRRPGLVAALFAILALLLAPLAASMPACPMMGGVASMMHAASTHDSGTPGDSSLCERHCQDAQPAVGLGRSPSPPQPALVSPMRVPVSQPVAIRMVGWHSSRFSAGPAPPLIRFTVLRI
jgi:hypothetical protein